jgi:hypothetical protein
MLYCLNASNTEVVPAPGPYATIYRQPLVGPTSITAAVGTPGVGTPIKITTATAHGLTTGQLVAITNTTGITTSTPSPSGSINRTWPVTVVDSTSFTLDGSALLAAYTGGGEITPFDQFVVNLQLSPMDLLDRQGLFGLLYQLDGATFTPAKYIVSYYTTCDGLTVTDTDYFEVRAGGDSDGNVLSMDYWTRPEGGVILAQLASGKIGTGASPAAIQG